MKKSIIATGAASLALAAMPIVGVFATGNTLTDHIEVTVPAACSITNGNTDEDAAQSNVNNYYKAEIKNGQYKVITAADSDPAHHTSPQVADNTVEVSCNSTSGDASTSWRLTAIGDGETGHKAELYNATGTATDNKNVIASAATPVTAAGGDTSDWSFKVSQTGNAATAASGFGFDTFYQIPSAEKDLATGNGSTAVGAFTMTYGVYVSGTQEAGTYTGAVKYTLYNPAS